MSQPSVFPIPRRSALARIGLALGAAVAGATAADRPRRVLLRSSWQTVNIGDIAHTPGVLHLLEQHLPEAEITLWPSSIANGVEELLRARFPKLKFAKGKDDLERAFAESDFLLHGSGPSLVAQKDVERWSEATGKPYGVYGITVARPASDEAFARTLSVLSGARFVFFRDSRSLALVKAAGCTAPVMAFGPDGAFACDLKDDERPPPSSPRTGWRRASSSAASRGSATRPTGSSRTSRRTRPSRSSTTR